VAAALVIALLVIAVVRAGFDELGGLLFRAGVIVVAVVLGWSFLNRASERDRADERRALDQRAADLVGRAIVPGSVIACLEATSGDAVEGGCERAVFASPETLAAATSYMSARLSLLADAHDYATRRDTSYETSIAGLRRMIAADRFGLASQVLSARDGCTAEACDAFNLVYDDKRLRANLRERLFDQLVGRYSVNWPARAPRPVASAPPPTADTPTASSMNLQFPSSQSIPPVSIMNNEPTGPAAAPPPQNGAPTTAATTPPPATAETKAPPAKRPRPAAAPSTAANGTTTPAPLSLAPKQP
jgi:hypothetical protein